MVTHTAIPYVLDDFSKIANEINTHLTERDGSTVVTINSCYDVHLKKFNIVVVYATTEEQ